MIVLSYYPLVQYNYVKEVISMINLLCIDDDQKFLNDFLKILSEYENIRTFTYTSLPKKIPSVDACFLDIEIYNQTSIEWSKQLNNIPIIFVSHYDHYVFDVIKLHIFDYIRKSHFNQEIHQTIHKLLEHLYNHQDFLIFQYKGFQHKIALMDIIYVEIYSHHCFIHTTSQTYDIKKGFKELNAEAPYLIKTHPSYIINLYYCLSLSHHHAYMKNNLIIPISVRKYSSVKEKFQKHHIHASISSI